MQHIRSGDEVLVSGLDGIEAVIKKADKSADDREPVKATNVDEIIERLRKRKEKQGLAVLDAEFEADVREAHGRYNAPVDGTRWD